MLKRDLYYKLKEDFPHLKNETIKGALDTIFETMLQGLVEKKSIVLRHFGALIPEEKKMPKQNLGAAKEEDVAKTYLRVKFIAAPKLKRIEE
jgi:nucleoid DNA-binding protein